MQHLLNEPSAGTQGGLLITGKQLLSELVLWAFWVNLSVKAKTLPETRRRGICLGS